MSNETNFAQGIFYNEPHERAPDFVKGKLRLKADKLIQWLQQQTPNEYGYVDCVIKVGQSGKPYVALDDWRPTGGKQRAYKPTPEHVARTAECNAEDFGSDEDIPF